MPRQVRRGDKSIELASLSVILCARHNQRQGACYAEQSEEDRP
jgi:hypothetical protein